MMHHFRPTFLIPLLLVTACNPEETKGGYDPERIARLEKGIKQSKPVSQELSLKDQIAEAQRLKDQAKAKAKAKISSSPEPHYWMVKAYFSGCPEVSDWFQMQDIIQDGNFENDHLAELPDRCIGLKAGNRLVAPLKEHRETYTYKGHQYESFSLADGTKLWGDGMDDITTHDLGLWDKWQAE